MARGRPKGHDFGQTRDTPPAGLTWGAYVEHFVEQLGGHTPLADELIRRVAAGAEPPDDLQTVEKGLRRLARREQLSGGLYGRWMLRHFGVPAAVEDWARWLGQYHSRFADLPTSLRRAQLRLWDRPPASESRVAAWIQVGLASVCHRQRELESCQAHLHRAEAGAERAGPAALLEVLLLATRLATDADERERAEQLLSAAEALSLDPSLTRADKLCYRARVLQQHAYHLTKPERGRAADVEAALRLFQSIEEDPALPFVAFRKCAGLAYCTWQLGDPIEGARLARLAAEYAGDGGFVRFRIMAFNLLTRMLPPEEARSVSERALRLSRQLEDEDLIERVLLRRRGGS
jgi:hypothetical protein